MDPPRAKRRRAQKACHFCRQRKMRCGNEEPDCLNCVTYKEVCYYEQRPKKARPSNSRISRLEEENRLLQQRLAKQTFGKPEDGKSESGINLTGNRADADDSYDAFSGNGETSSSSSSSPSRASGNNKIPEFHGPTSVFFDENPLKDGQRPKVRTRNLSFDHVSSDLLAEAAAQRQDLPPILKSKIKTNNKLGQLENLRLSSNQLDLDGVEPDLATELLSLFWARSNPLFMLVYRPVFMRDWVDGGPYFSRLLLNAIYFNASRYVIDKKCGAVGTKLGERFRKRFKDLLGAAYDRSRITTMQGLLLVAVSLSAVGKDRSLAWLYSGLGFRMMFDLGLHTGRPDPTKARKASQENVESNHRLFWSAYVIDKLQSFYQGRPANVQEADTMVELAFHDQYEELDDWHPLPFAPIQRAPYAPMYCVSNFFSLCRLAIIMNKILNKIYRERNEIQGPEPMTRSLTQLNEELEEWRTTLPPQLQLSPTSIGKEGAALPSPHIYVSLIMYHVVQILLHRPFVSYGHLQSVLPAVALDSFSTCAVAANRIAQYLESYNRVHSLQFAPFFLFYASYVSATIHVRIAAQKHLDTDAFACLRVCLSVFDQNELNNPAVKKAKAVIQRLMTNMGVKCPNNKACTPTASKTPPREKEEEEEEEEAEKSQPTPQTDKSPPGSTTPTPNTTPATAPMPISDTDLLQGWDIADLDFDAILQSFGRPTPTQVGPDGTPAAAAAAAEPSNAEFMTAAEAMNQNINAPWSGFGTGQAQGGTGDYYAQQQALGGDVLFGFEGMGGKGEW